MINVTKCYLPPKEEYIEKLNTVWETHWLTNQGQLTTRLENELKKFLNVDYFQYVTNGTIALQIAIEALDLKGSEIITTPFSFVATTSTILWENCIPIFVDIDPITFNIDTKKIEEKITENTKAIMAVHVFGRPCDVIALEEIGKKHNLKIIYDAAHAFGINYKGKSLLSYGDISTCSFHATKVFHTIEGGCCISNSKAIDRRLELMKKFGFEGENFEEIGINGKNSEFHAAMGLCVLDHFPEIISRRKEISSLYDELLKGVVELPKKYDEYEYNYIYYPVLFKNENELNSVFSSLKDEGITARRYFYPSLNLLPYYDNVSCPISEDIATRIACLPLDTYLQDEEVNKICRTIKKTLKK